MALGSSVHEIDLLAVDARRPESPVASALTKARVRTL